MTSCHHTSHQSPACCCSRRCNSNPPPIDPILLQAVVSQLLQNPQTLHLYSPALNPALFASNSTQFDLHHGSPQYSHHQNLKHPKQKHRQQFEDQSQNQYSALSSLLQRIDVLESSLHRFSSASAFSLRHVAARTIQVHFRAYLVRRSKALRELKELASIKSDLNVLKSSLSLQKRIDFFSLPREALDLISRLESIQSGDQMVRDSKSSIRREISRFLELVDEICAKRNQVSLKTVKQIRVVRKDEKPRVSYVGKQRNLDSGEKKLLDHLRGRVERIQLMSKALKDEEDLEGSDDDNGAISRKIYSRSGNQHRLQQSHVEKPEKHVWFSEDRNNTRVYDIQEDEDEEVESDIDENDAVLAGGSIDEDEEQNGSLDGSSQSSEAEETRRRSSRNESDQKKGNLSHQRQGGKLILSAPPPVTMEPRA